MLRRFYTQLPDFARPDNPVMRYALQRSSRATRRTQIIRLVATVLLLAFVLILGWQIATDLGRTSLSAPSFIDKIFLILFWPLVLLQIVMRLFALGSGSNVIPSETQHGTWDTLKVTTDGAVLAMKTRWAAVFYRLRILLVVLLVTRILFIIGALVDLASFQGRYLDLLLSGTKPFGSPNVPSDVSVVLGILTMSMMMAGCLLAPFTTVAFDAGLGMLIGTLSRGRLMSILGQFTLGLIRILITAYVLFIGAAALSLGPIRLTVFTPADNSLAAWLGAFFGIAEGDLGLTLLHLPHVQQLWADIDYGVLVGIAFLGYTLLQAALANLFVKWAGRRATQPDTV